MKILFFVSLSCLCCLTLTDLFQQGPAGLGSFQQKSSMVFSCSRICFSEYSLGSSSSIQSLPLQQRNYSHHYLLRQFFNLLTSLHFQGINFISMGYFQYLDCLLESDCEKSQLAQWVQVCSSGNNFLSHSKKSARHEMNFSQHDFSQASIGTS